MRIHNGLFHLRTSCRYWAGVKWFLRIFEVLSERMSLLLEDGDLRDDNLSNSKNDRGPTNPFIGYNIDSGNGDTARTASGLDPVTDRTNVDFHVVAFDGIGSSDDFGLIGGKASELWLQELLGGDMMGYDENFTIMTEIPVQ